MAVSPRKRIYSTQKRARLSCYQRRRWSLLLCLMLLTGSLTYQRIRLMLLEPEAIFVLGGHEEREKYAAQLAQREPGLDVWISSGSPPHYVEHIFSHYGISGDRLHLDYQAQDTVTNFTSMVERLKAENIESVYLITSENHMQRAKIVANIIFGSQGIAVKPIAVPSQNPPEAKLKCVRDGFRAVLWVFTRETGAGWFQGDRRTAMTEKIDKNKNL